MKRIDIKVLAVLLSGMHLCLTSQAFAADDVSKAAEALAKLYNWTSHSTDIYLAPLLHLMYKPIPVQDSQAMAKNQAPLDLKSKA